jgi:hypothetical protein
MIFIPAHHRNFSNTWKLKFRQIAPYLWSANDLD